MITVTPDFGLHQKRSVNSFTRAVEPSLVAEYLDTSLELGQGMRANREKACLSSMFTWLIRTGQAGVKKNPHKGVKRNKDTKRERYVEDEEMHATLEKAPLRSGRCRVGLQHDNHLAPHSKFRCSSRYPFRWRSQKA